MGYISEDQLTEAPSASEGQFKAQTDQTFTEISDDQLVDAPDGYAIKSPTLAMGVAPMIGANKAVQALGITAQVREQAAAKQALELDAAPGGEYRAAAMEKYGLTTPGIVIGPSLGVRLPGLPGMSTRQAKEIQSRPIELPQTPTTLQTPTNLSAETAFGTTEETSYGRPLEETISPEARQTARYQAAETLGQLPITLGGAAFGRGFGLETSQALEIGGMYERAKKAGASEEDAIDAAMAAGPLGMLDAVGNKLFTRLLTRVATVARVPVDQLTTKVARFVAKHPYASATAGMYGEELPTELMQTIGEDRIAQEYWNETIDYWKSIGDTTKVVTLMSLMAGPFGAAGARSWAQHKMVSAPNFQTVTEDDFAPTTGPAATQPGGAYSDAEVQAQFEAAQQRTAGAPPSVDATQFYPPGYGVQEEPAQVPTPIAAPLVSPPIPTGPETRTTGPATSVLPTELPPHSEPALPARASAPSSLASPVQDLLQQRFVDRTIAEATATEATKQFGRSFHVWSTPNGLVLRLGPQPRGPDEIRSVQGSNAPLGTQVSSSSEQTEAERLRSQVVTPEGLTQDQVDQNLVDINQGPLAELRARFLAQQTQQTPTIEGVQDEEQRQEQGQEEGQTANAYANETQEKLQVASAQTQVSSKLEQTTQMLATLPENVAGFKSKLSAGVLMSKLRKQFPNAQLEVSKQPDNMWRIQPRVEAPKAVQVKAPAKAMRRLGAKRDIADQILEEEGLSELDFDEGVVSTKGEETAPEGSDYEGLRITKLYSFDPLLAVTDLNKTFDKLPGGGALTRLGNTYRKNLSIPSWAALVKEKFGAWYKQSSQIAAKWEEPLYESLSTLDGWHRLAHAEYQKLNKMAWDIEGRQLKAVPSPQLVFSKDAQGGKQVALNPQYLRELEAFMRTKGFSDDAIQTFIATRKGMDQDFATHYNTLAKDPTVDVTTLEELEQSIGFVPNYLPHNFYGNHFIEGRDVNGELRARLPIQVGALGKMLGATTKVGRLIKALESVPEYKGLTWDRTLKASDEQSRYYINTPVSTEVIGRVLDEAAKSLEAQSSARPELATAAEAIRKALPREVLEILRTRGFSNYAKRSGILGYEKQDLLRVLADYKVGMYGSLRKMETAREYARHMIASKPEKLEWEMLDRYFEDQMAPHGRVDSMVAIARDVMYMRYMAGRVKPAVVNLSNQIVTGIPLLGLHTGPTSAVLHKQALWDITKQFAKESTQKLRRIGVFGHPNPTKNILSQDMLTLMKKSQADGTVQPQMVREMLRDLKKGYRAVPKMLNQAIATSRDLLTLPMEMTEWYSRAATFKASAEAMSEGKISNQKTLAEYGLKAGEKVALTDPRVYDFARTITLQSHGEYGVHNRPPIMRSGTAGKIASSAYTFRFFQHNLMELWGHMLKQGPRGVAAFSASVAGQVATGGLMKGIPLAGTMMLMYGALTGDDPEEKLRIALPGSEDMKDALLYGGMAYGIPTPFGNVPKVAIGSSVEFDLPESVQELFKFAVSGQEPMIREDPTTEALGVVGGTVKDVIGAFNAWASGNTERALEYIAPLIILRDVLAANRLATQGTYTLTGRPIVQPGDEGPQTITTPEARMRALGFQPLSIEKGYRLRASMEKAGMFRKGAQTKLANRFATAFNGGDDTEMEAVLDEIMAWNIKWGASEHPEYMIDPRRAIETRMKPDRGDTRLRGRAMELREAYGF